MSNDELIPLFVSFFSKLDRKKIHINNLLTYESDKELRKTTASKFVSETYEMIIEHFYGITVTYPSLSIITYQVIILNLKYTRLMSFFSQAKYEYGIEDIEDINDIQGLILLFEDMYKRIQPYDKERYMHHPRLAFEKASKFALISFFGGANYTDPTYLDNKIKKAKLIRSFDSVHKAKEQLLLSQGIKPEKARKDAFEISSKFAVEQYTVSVTPTAHPGTHESTEYRPIFSYEYNIQGDYKVIEKKGTYYELQPRKAQMKGDKEQQGYWYDGIWYDQPGVKKYTMFVPEKGSWEYKRSNGGSKSNTRKNTNRKSNRRKSNRRKSNRRR
jgi:hypothetical protein